jgi:replication-associated recombination protein RarA
MVGVVISFRNPTRPQAANVGLEQHQSSLRCYAHNEPEAYAAEENYFPDELVGGQYYQPVDRGLKIKIEEELKHLKDLDRNAT